MEKEKKTKTEAEKEKFKSLQQINSPKTVFGAVGTMFEQVEILLRFSFWPLFILAFAFSCSVATLPVSVFFLSLCLGNFVASKCIGMAFKDDFKDAADSIDSKQNNAEVEEYVKTCEHIQSLQAELDSLRQKNNIPTKTKSLDKTNVQQHLPKPKNIETNLEL